MAITTLGWGAMISSGFVRHTASPRYAKLCGVFNERGKHKKKHCERIFLSNKGAIP
jgi:hypothetical protein